MRKCLIVILAFLVQSLWAQPRQYLHDGWTFGQARKTNRYEAKVPGVVHTDLLRHHLIDDPYIGLNERKVQWVYKEDWIYETTFRVSDDVNGNDHIELCFDGLDTLWCTVFP